MNDETEWREGWEDDLREWKEESRRIAAREPDLWYDALLCSASSQDLIDNPMTQVLRHLAIGDEEQGAQATPMQAGLRQHVPLFLQTADSPQDQGSYALFRFRGQSFNIDLLTPIMMEQGLLDDNEQLKLRLGYHDDGNQVLGLPAYSKGDKKRRQYERLLGSIGALGHDNQGKSTGTHPI